MEINKAIKTENGTVEFRGELTQDEFDLVLQVGLSTLFAHGAIPFTVVDDEEEAAEKLSNMVKGTDTAQ
jgi:hypothetical protein